MNIILKVFIFIMMPLMVFSSEGGDQVGNGGGLGEQNVYYGFINLKNIYLFCLKSDQCLSNKKEKALLTKIYNSLDQEYKGTGILRFLSGHDRPDIFKINGQFKAAVTGNKVGDIIYINTDRLYKKNHQGYVEPVGIGSAMGLLTHELGHHHNILEHDFLELLGSRIRAFSTFSMTQLYVDNYLDGTNIRSPLLKLTGIHKQLITGRYLDGAQSSLLFADENFLHDLTPWVSDAVSVCPRFRNNPASKNIGYRLFDIKWGDMYYRDGSEAHRTYVITSRVELFCEDNVDTSYPVRFDTSRKLIIKLPIEYTYKRNSGVLNSYWGLRRGLIQVKFASDELKLGPFF